MDEWMDGWMVGLLEGGADVDGLTGRWIGRDGSMSSRVVDDVDGFENRAGYQRL